ncbi:hypothetical protein HK100_011035 [Physocladia obscura]|uniref:Uncharacterized protein n=1 Tax=Physocladia obscura TaxID=109957 RepID=A0AAD5XGW4_9FUNG|nr:hypothetical protein HK100_011035 [Physocladia obscura]
MFCVEELCADPEHFGRTANSSEDSISISNTIETTSGRNKADKTEFRPKTSRTPPNINLNNNQNQPDDWDNTNRSDRNSAKHIALTTVKLPGEIPILQSLELRKLALPSPMSPQKKQIAQQDVITIESDEDSSSLSKASSSHHQQQKQQTRLYSRKASKLKIISYWLMETSKIRDGTDFNKQDILLSIRGNSFELSAGSVEDLPAVEQIRSFKYLHVQKHLLLLIMKFPDKSTISFIANDDANASSFLEVVTDLLGVKHQHDLSGEPLPYIRSIIESFFNYLRHKKKPVPVRIPYADNLKPNTVNTVPR